MLEEYHREEFQPQKRETPEEKILTLEQFQSTILTPDKFQPEVLSTEEFHSSFKNTNH